MSPGWDLGFDLRFVLDKLLGKRDALVRVLRDHAEAVPRGQLERICALPDTKTVEHSVTFDHPTEWIAVETKEATWDFSELKQLAQDELKRRADATPST